MADHPAPKAARPWKVIAEEAAREDDSRKMSDLVKELNQALEEQGMVKPVAEKDEKKSA